MGVVRTSRGCRALHFANFLLSVLVLPTGHAQTTVAGITPGSFRVNESGAATYTIPIQVPPGVAGLEPKLAFTYNSKGRNGLLGMGWGLSGLSAITRCPRTIVQDGGARAGVNFDVNDRFCLDGQRLVMVSPSPAVYGGDGVDYRTERESFTKVISYGQVSAPGSGPQWFKVWTKAGQILEYGNDAPNYYSRVEAQGKTSVRVWALNKISDKKGNYLTVAYAEDNANGDFYPTQIAYNYTSATPNASVQFVPEPTTRPDVVPAYVAGSVVKTLKRLAYVRTYIGANLVKEYRLAYDSKGSVGASRLLSITECSGDGTCLNPITAAWQRDGDGAMENGGQWITTATFGGTGYNWTGDFNGDGKTDIASASGTTLYLYFGNGNGTFTAAPPTTVPVVNAPGYNFTGDFDGDGKTDIAVAYGPSLYLYLGNGNGFTVANTTPVPQWNTSKPGYNLTGDFNGDGKTDIAVAYGSSLYLYLGNGNGFTVANTTTVPIWNTPDYIFTGDFNGDGKTDIAVAYATSLYLYLGNDNGFTVANTTPVPTWGGVGYNFVGDFNGDGKTDIAVAVGANLYLYLGSDNGFIVANTTPVPALNYTSPRYNFTGDFNGDGKTDIAVAYGTSLYLYLGNGTGFTVANTTTVPIWNTPDYNFRGDFNGDGKTDFAVAYGPNLYLYLGSGNGFTIGNTIAVPTWGGAEYRWTGDFNGDGKTDIATAVGASAYVYQGGPVRVFPDLLARITDSLGKSTSIAYSPLTDTTVYTKGGGASYPVVDLQVPLYVVSSTRTTDGSFAPPIPVYTNYNYSGLKAHQQGGGLLGFQQVKATDLQTNITTATNFRQDYPFQGLPVSISKTAPGWGGTLVANGWTTSLIPLTPSTGTYHRCDLTSSQESGVDLNGAALPTITTTSTYDGFGNPKSVAVSASDGFTKTTGNDYFDPDTLNWILGRVRQSTVTSVTP